MDRRPRGTKPNQERRGLPLNLWVIARDLAARPGASSLFRGHGQEEAAGCGMTRKSQRHLGRPSVRKLLADNFLPGTVQDATTDYPQSRATMQVFLLSNGAVRGRRQ